MKKILAIASMILIWVSGAYAAGTTAGTQITNSVTVSYDVALIHQTPIDANDGSGFLVDKKIDLTVTNDDTNQITVTPGAQDQNTTWTVTNTSNTAQYFTLASSNLATGKTVYSDADTAQTDTQTIYYSTNGGTSYSLYTSAVSIAADGNIKVIVSSDIPLTVGNGDVMNIQLLATATDSGGTPITATSGADTAGSVDTVLADGTGDASYDGTHYDGKYQVWGGYKVESAALTVTKGSCIIWDPVNTTTNPKRIPLSVVRYTIQVHNTGLLPGTSVSAVDLLPSEVTYGVGSSGLTAVHRISTEQCNCASPGSSNGDTVSENSGTVTANFGTVSAVTNTYECAYFDVTIQ